MACPPHIKSYRSQKNKRRYALLRVERDLSGVGLSKERRLTEEIRMREHTKKNMETGWFERQAEQPKLHRRITPGRSISSRLELRKLAESRTKKVIGKKAKLFIRPQKKGVRKTRLFRFRRELPTIAQNKKQQSGREGDGARGAKTKKHGFRQRKNQRGRKTLSGCCSRNFALTWLHSMKRKLKNRRF